MEGIKYDEDKIRPRLVINSMSRAMQSIAEVGTFGAQKYSEDNWLQVEYGINRYTDAMYRHSLKEAEGEILDQESRLRHASHLAWCAIARLDLILRQEEENEHGKSNPTAG